MTTVAKPFFSRIKTIEIKSFRAFPAKEDEETGETKPFKLDFSADVVLVSGPNGVGKTSLADALNVTLNHPEIDERVLYDRGERRAVWRDGDKGYVCLNNSLRVGYEQLPERPGRTKTLTETPLAAFASVFYQADPNFRLDEYIDRARANAPGWIKGIQSKLSDTRVAIEMAISAYRPRNVPSKEEEVERRKDKVKLVQAALDKVEGEFAEKYFKGVILKNGNLGRNWRKKLAENMELPPAESHEALREIERCLQAEKDKREAERPDTETNRQRMVAWPHTGGRDPLCYFIDASHSVPDEEANSENQWLIPIQNEPIAAELRERVSTEKARAKAKQADIQALATAVERVSPRTGTPFEEKLVALSDEARSWLDAAEALKVEIPERLRDIAGTLVDVREGLGIEVAHFRKTIEARVSERRADYVHAGDAIRRADDMEAAVAFGESISADKEVLARIKAVLNGRRSIRLSELRNSFDRQTEFRDGETGLDPALEDGTKSLLDLIDAVQQWAKFESDAEQWASHRRKEVALGLAGNAAEPYLEAIDAFVARNNLLDAPPLSASDLQRLAALANQILVTTALGSKWDIELKIERGRVALRFVSPYDRSQRVEMPNLSTGQRTLACLALALAFNLLTEGVVRHEVLVLDDIGTALDLAQLPAFAFMLRALAYAPEGSPSRQIVLASHHEDMTDRFIDLLAPPNEKRALLVHAFEQWGQETGPTIATYEFREGPDEQVEEEDAKRVFASLVTRGVEWVEQRY